MPTKDIVLICFYIGAFGLFACVLAWADWQERRGKKQKAKKPD